MGVLDVCVRSRCHDTFISMLKTSGGIFVNPKHENWASELATLSVLTVLTEIRVYTKRCFIYSDVYTFCEIVLMILTDLRWCFAFYGSIWMDFKRSAAMFLLFTIPFWWILHDLTLNATFTFYIFTTLISPTKKLFNLLRFVSDNKHFF